MYHLQAIDLFRRDWYDRPPWHNHKVCRIMLPTSLKIARFGHHCLDGWARLALKCCYLTSLQGCGKLPACLPAWPNLREIAWEFGACDDAGAELQVTQLCHMHPKANISLSFGACCSPACDNEVCTPLFSRQFTPFPLHSLNLIDANYQYPAVMLEALLSRHPPAHLSMLWPDITPDSDALKLPASLVTAADICSTDPQLIDARGCHQLRNLVLSYDDDIFHDHGFEPKLLLPDTGSFVTSAPYGIVYTRVTCRPAVLAGSCLPVLYQRGCMNLD